MALSSADSAASLRLAIDYLPQGVAVFDAGLRLVVSNRRYNLLLALPEDLTRAGAALFDIALFLSERGDLGPGDPARLAIERINLLTEAPITVTQRLGNAGQTLEFQSSRLSDGGLVISFSDVTARVKAERELERVNFSLEGRVEERTADLTRVNAELEDRPRQGRCRQSRQDALSRSRQPRSAATAQCGAALYVHADRAGQIDRLW
ncbi:PAS domain-containing protein [Devosia riboflavina]